MPRPSEEGPRKRPDGHGLLHQQAHGPAIPAVCRHSSCLQIQAITQTTRQIDLVIDSFKETVADEAETVGGRSDLFQIQKSRCTSVDQFLNDERLRNFVSRRSISIRNTGTATI